nr:hypothetical protein [bacterium]
VYYRCTKKNRDVACSQPFTRQESLVAQFLELTSKIALPEDWAIPMLAELDRRELEAATGTVGKMLELDLELGEIAAKLRRLNDLNIDGELDRTEYAERKRGLVNEKIAKEALKLKIARQGALYWLEPLREVLNAVRESNLPTAGGDPSELRNFVAKVGSNLRIESRKVLWDWVPTYALLAERGQYQEWWAILDSNQ